MKNLMEELKFPLVTKIMKASLNLVHDSADVEGVLVILVTT